MKYFASGALFAALIKSRIASSAYCQAWNKYTFYTKISTISSYIDDIVGCKIFINF